MSVIPMPPAAGPDPGQPGHFAHHDWLEAAVLALDGGGSSVQRIGAQNLITPVGPITAPAIGLVNSVLVPAPVAGNIYRAYTTLSVLNNTAAGYVEVSIRWSPTASPSGSTQFAYGLITPSAAGRRTGCTMVGEFTYVGTDPEIYLITTITNQAGTGQTVSTFANANAPSYLGVDQVGFDPSLGAVKPSP